MKSFDQATYWRNRVSGKLGLGAVGHRSLGAAYSRWIYQPRVDVLNNLHNEAIKADSDVRVLDLGCGSGFYESYWQSRGVRHPTYVDISAQNVAALREHVKFRGRDHFIDMLHSQGLEIEQETPLFVLLVPPVYGKRLVDLLIAGVYYAAGLVFRAIPLAGSLAGRLAYAIDGRLMKRGILTPNNCLYIVRRMR